MELVFYILVSVGALGLTIIAMMMSHPRLMAYHNGKLREWSGRCHPSAQVAQREVWVCVGTTTRQELVRGVVWYHHNDEWFQPSLIYNKSGYVFRDAPAHAPDEITEIERCANAEITQNHMVVTELQPGAFWREVRQADSCT